MAGETLLIVDDNASNMKLVTFLLTNRGYDVRTELDLSSEPESFIFLTLPTPNAGYEYDLRARYRINDEVSVRAGILNITDKYPPYLPETFTGTGRAIAASASSP